VDKEGRFETHRLEVIVQGVWNIVIFKSEQEVIHGVGLDDIKSSDRHNIIEELGRVIRHLNVEQRNHDDHLLGIDHRPELVHRRGEGKISNQV
jgi:hypothetical protein